MKVPTDLPDVRPVDLVVDNSILSDVTCSTRGALRHVLGWTTPDEAPELMAGSAIHEGLARWIVKGGSAKAALARFDKVYEPWAATHVPKLDPKDQKPHRLRWKPVHDIFAHWLEHHPIEKTGFALDPAHVEIPVWAPMAMRGKDGKWYFDAEEAGEEYRRLGSKRPPTIFFLALLDAIGKKLLSGGKGGWWSWDHKTSKSMGSWYKDRQEDTSQFTGQLWAGKQRGLTLNGVHINGIELPSLNTSENTCRRHGMPYNKCALQHVNSLVFPVTRSGHEILAWQWTAERLTRKFVKLKSQVRDIHDVRELPMEGRFQGQCSRCSFRDFCRTGRPIHAQHKFVVEFWNPLDHAGKRGGLRDGG